MNFLRCALAFAVLGIATSAAGAQEHWVASWAVGSAEGAGETLPSSGITYRNIVHLSLGGKQIRLTLSNRFNSEPLLIGGVTVAHSSGHGAQDTASLQTAMFGGKPTIVIAPGTVVVSDPVKIDVATFEDLDVSLFLPAQKVTLFTDHPVSHQTNYRANGNQAGAATMQGATALMPWSTLVAVDVMAPASDAAIAAFGDSITDGQGTTDDANLRWPNQLATRLQADPRTARFSVVDVGIGSNRLLHASGEPSARAGAHPAGVDRWSWDALDRAGVKYIILLEGVNDIGHSSMLKEGGRNARQEKVPESTITADGLIRADTEMIAQAHARGIKVIGATLTPYGGAGYDRPDGQEIRRVLNEFIRHGGKFDGVVDFDKATQDPSQPLKFLPAYDKGDHLHPNDAGAKAMADSVNLGLFQ